MELLRYNELDVTGVAAQVDRIAARLRAGDFRGADVKKLKPTPYYRAKLNDADRLLFRFGAYRGVTYVLLLEVIRNHAYERSRFLNGAAVDESKLEPLPAPLVVSAEEAFQLPYVNPQSPHFHILDKMLSFDDFQNEAFALRPPLILIGSAGSGKTVLSIEKLKQLPGEVLYVTLSAYLAENARNLYSAFEYENPSQDIAFLSFKEYLESLRVPRGRPVTFSAFAQWFGRHRAGCPIRDAHRLFEEFNGVLTGSDIGRPFLSRGDYLSLGVRRSIFTFEEREVAYDLFEKYLAHIREVGLFDMNLTAYEWFPLVEPTYDFAVVDEVQDLTNVQLHLILRSLRISHNFILCGDSNQIVHPNFFSWANVKTMFYREQGQEHREIVRILNTNYRNSPQVTDVANRLLRIKNARFGSIDRESNYLVHSIGASDGMVTLLKDTEKVRRDLDEKTRRSTRFAVLCLRPEDKDATRAVFRTPLVFSIQESKGLEYENVILFNFVVGHGREYNAIAEGVTAADLDADLRYARAKDKTDKSLEIFKFYVNAMYVGLTRAIRNLYIVDGWAAHDVYRLLNLECVVETGIVEQTSSDEEWKREARRLEMQGKTEQADDIRRRILSMQPVPWRILSPETLEELKKEALDPSRMNKPAKQLLYDYAIFYPSPEIFTRLVELGYNRARTPGQDRDVVVEKYTQDFRDPTFRELIVKLRMHGVDFRNPLNHTPLMVAALLGRENPIRFLIGQDADLRLRDNAGRTALQLALREAYLNKSYALNKIGAVYGKFAPASVNVEVDGRLVKLDKHIMEYFLLNSMLAILQDVLQTKAGWKVPAFQVDDFHAALQHFPDRVIPEYRRQRHYISSVLAKNEVSRQGSGSRRLFLRIFRGYYVPNPTLAIEVAEDEWVNVYDLVRLDTMEGHGDLKKLSALVKKLRDNPPWVPKARKEIAAAPNPPPGKTDESAAEPVEGGDVSVAATVSDQPGVGEVGKGIAVQQDLSL